jgi:hypothetical protein
VKVLVKFTALALLVAVSTGGFGEIRKKDPAEERKEGDGAGAPPAEAAPPEGTEIDEEDAGRLKALVLRREAWENSATLVSPRGLQITGMIVPDALSYKALVAYLERREKGDGHAAAVSRVAALLPRWKRFEKTSLLAIKLSNMKHKLSDAEHRIFTLERPLAEESVVLQDARQRRLRLALAANPENLRLASLRVKKFWTTRDGATRRVRPPGDPGRLDPASIGREAMVSKLFPALLLEEKPAQVELLLRRQDLEKAAAGFRLSFLQWKRYEGPFEKNTLDLNQNRVWDEVPDLEMQLELPPAGFTVSPEVEELMAEIRAGKAASKTRGPAHPEAPSG